MSTEGPIQRSMPSCMVDIVLVAYILRDPDILPLQSNCWKVMHACTVIEHGQLKFTGGVYSMPRCIEWLPLRLVVAWFNQG